MGLFLSDLCAGDCRGYSQSRPRPPGFDAARARYSRINATRSRDGSRHVYVAIDRLLHDLHILGVEPAGGIVADDAVILRFALAIFQLRETGSSYIEASMAPFQRTRLQRPNDRTAWLRGQTRIVLSMRDRPQRSDAAARPCVVSEAPSAVAVRSRHPLVLMQRPATAINAARRYQGRSS
jgi:hypothetical protein